MIPRMKTSKVGKNFAWKCQLGFRFSSVSLDTGGCHVVASEVLFVLSGTQECLLYGRTLRCLPLIYNMHV